MTDAKRRVTMTLAGVAVLCAPALARASGQMPLLPTTETFKTHEACLAELEASFARDRGQVVPRSVKPNGETREVSFDSRGVETISDRVARYEATIWYHNGSYRAEFKKTNVSHSYEHRILECDGAALKTTGEQGYTLSTFEPQGSLLPPAADKP